MQKIFLLPLFILGFCGYSQVSDSTKTKFNYNVSYEASGQWYTNDVNRKINHDKTPLRSNNYLSLNFNYGKFYLGTQIESYVNEALLNYNPKFRKTDIGTAFVGFKNNKLDITLGHFYEQFGSGLALRSWEDRSLGINNAIFGAKLTYKPNNIILVTALGGRQRSGFNTMTSFEYDKGYIIGLNTQLNISEMFKTESFGLNYGFSFVGRKENLPNYVNNFSDFTNVFSNRLEFTKKAFYLNSEYVFKTKDALLDLGDLNYDFAKPGNALLINFGYSKKGIGFDASVRRLENMQFLSQRNPDAYPSLLSTSINYNDRIMNFIPSLTKQHHSSLANIYVYQSQSQVVLNESTLTNKAGEIGGQFDLFYEFKKGSSLGGKYGTKIAANVASWYNLKGQYKYYDNLGNYKPNYKTEFLGSKEKYFSDYNIEIAKKFSPKLKSSIAVINQFYNDQQIRGIFQKSEINSTIVFSETSFFFPKSKSLTIGLEHMWADADRKNWVGGNLEYNHNSNWSVFMTDMYNYGFDHSINTINEVDLFDIHFYNFGTAYKKGSTRIALNYGRQRGGLVCAGGVCRYVPPSTGLGIQLSTSF